MNRLRENIKPHTNQENQERISKKMETMNQQENQERTFEHTMHNHEKTKTNEQNKT